MMGLYQRTGTRAVLLSHGFIGADFRRVVGDMTIANIGPPLGPEALLVLTFDSAPTISDAANVRLARPFSPRSGSVLALGYDAGELAEVWRSE